MNIRHKANKHQEITDQLIKVLADNNVTYEEAPDVLESVRTELNHLCTQQVIKIS